MALVKFNNSSGSSEQQYCHNGCGIHDPSTGISGREDGNGNPIDIYYNDSTNLIVQGLGKCFNCQKVSEHFGA